MAVGAKGGAGELQVSMAGGAAPSADAPPERVRGAEDDFKSIIWEMITLGRQYERNYLSVHWKTFLVIWFMPIITAISIVLSIITGFWFTAFSSINNESMFFYPILFGFLLSLINMVIQPLFILARFFGYKRKWNCYDVNNGRESGGKCFLQDNFKKFIGINIYIGVCIIIGKLGTTMLKTQTTGGKWLYAKLAIYESDDWDKIYINLGKLCEYSPIIVTVIIILFNLIGWMRYGSNNNLIQ